MRGDVNTAEGTPATPDATVMLKRANPWPPLAVFALFAVTAALLGYADYQGQRRAIELEKRNELVAIADLKVAQLDEWLRERRANAEVKVRNSLFGIEARHWLRRGGTDDKTRDRLLQSMLALQEVFDYRTVILFDEQGAVRLAVTPGAMVGANEYQLALAAMRNGQVMVSDLHFEPGDSGVIELDIFAPLLVEEHGVPKTVGVLCFSIDARRYLYPLIQSWPTPSPSGETLLVRRDGDDVVFLNELRHRKNTALTLRIPVSTPELPAARVLRGESGPLQGFDYRGVPVLAVPRKVPNSSWYLVAKVDSAEILAPLAERARLDAILATILFAAAALALAFWWRRQQMRELSRHFGEIDRINAALEQRVIDRTARLQAINAELDAFSYSVSHDLRAPLRAIQGFSGIVAERHRAALNEEGQRYFDNIVVAAEHMDRMIDDLLRYARLGGRASERDVKSLREILAVVATMFEEQARQTGATLTLPSELPDVMVSGRLVEQILENLIANALTYRRPGVAAQVVVACARKDDGLLLRVTDNGIGIAPEHHELIFNVFQRLHGAEDHPGTGIGLALVKKAATLLGGRVRLESRPGEGSSFFVEIPVERGGEIGPGIQSAP